MVTVIIGPGTMAPDNPTANDVAVNISISIKLTP
jgi:hypothetical protein